MPEIGGSAQGFPFALICGWDCVADVAAEGFPGRVMRGALFSAVERGDGSVEVIVESADIFRGQVRRGVQDAVGHRGDYSADGIWLG